MLKYKQNSLTRNKLYTVLIFLYKYPFWIHALRGLRGLKRTLYIPFIIHQISQIFKYYVKI